MAKTISHKSTEDILVENINIVLDPLSGSDYTLRQLCGDNINNLIYSWFNILDVNQIKTDVEFYLKYREKEANWIFEGRLDFCIYNDHTTSIVYHEIKDDEK